MFVAQKRFRKFADKFYATLPPELRDLVYVHIWDDATLDRVFDNVCVDPVPSLTSRRTPPSSWRQVVLSNSDDVKGMPWSVFCAQHPCNCFQWWELPYWAQHIFVGLDVAREAVAAYYRAMRHGRLGPHLGQLETFLSTDHFHLGVIPADHIRHLELNFDDRLIEYGDGYNCLTKSRKGSQVLQRNLEALLKLRVKQGFQLTIKFDWVATNLNSNAALKVLRPVAYKIQEAGGSVTLLARFGSLRKDFDVSDYFDLPHDYWKHKWTIKMMKEKGRKKRFGHEDFIDNAAFIFSGLMGQNALSVFGLDDDPANSDMDTTDPAGEDTSSGHPIGTLHSAANDNSDFDNSDFDNYFDDSDFDNSDFDNSAFDNSAFTLEDSNVDSSSVCSGDSDTSPHED